MAPNGATVTGLLRQTVYYHLDNSSWENALFFAERLLAHDPRSNESTFLLALSHLRLDDHRSAYEVSKPLGYRGLHLGCAFVFAQSCLALERHRDGVLALEKAKGLWLHKSNLGKHTATSRLVYPDAATVYCLLGKLCRGMDDRKKAATYFEDALRANPLMWDAFTALCDMGLALRVSNTFRVTDALVRCFQQVEPPPPPPPPPLHPQQQQLLNQVPLSQPQPQPQSQPYPSDVPDLPGGFGYLPDQSVLAPKRPTSTRPPGLHDMNDPFDHAPSQLQPSQSQRAGAAAPFASRGAAGGGGSESEESDFMSRIFAARSRMAAAAAVAAAGHSGLGGSQLSDGDVATPPGRAPEPPQAPARRRAGGPPAATADSSLLDVQHQHQPQPPGAPSKIIYRLGTSTRRGKGLDTGGDLSTSEHGSSLLRAAAASSMANGGASAGAAGPASAAPAPAAAPAAAAASASAPASASASASGQPTASASAVPTLPSLSATTIERKRTASGHPVALRQPQAQIQAPGDDAWVPQRRSARLNMFKASGSGRPHAGAATIGGAATRELKKARPPISRIMRPGSSGSTVGRVVSGNRKPVDDGGMDIDPMEGPRVRDTAAAAAASAAAASSHPQSGQNQGQQSPQSQQQQSQQPHQQQNLSSQQSQQQHQQQQGHNAVTASQLHALKQQAAEADAAKTEEALRWLLELLKKLGGGYLALAQFQCTEALQVLNGLPRAHADTAWVQAQMGRAQYELAAYAEAEICFRRVRVLAPTRLEDMEVYSTILWFLKRETDLSFLAHELVDAAWRSPHAWCALGNAWSLAQDHEQALRCFRRATQLQPRFAYAYTLQGHEHVLNEEYGKALTAYRQAVAADRRHYNAYYGMGRVYERLGNFDKAYAHYQTASIIHPTNAVLVCCIGKVLERQKQIVPALQYFSKATDLAPRAAQTRFRKARALLALGQLPAAQQELMILKDLAPDEAAVHFLLGKLYKTLADKSAAVRHFTIALSLDPKASQKIKQAIGSLEDDEDGLEDYMVA